MRIRSIKPEFWASRTISQLSWDARLVLKGLESYVDDNGVGRFDIELIVSEVFPRDHFRNPPEVVARVSEAVSELSEASLIWIYEAEDASRGNRMVTAVFVSNWEDLQRIDKPNKGRIRRPDGTLEYRESVIRESSGNPPELFASLPEVSAPVTEEQRNRGTEEQSYISLADKSAHSCSTAPQSSATRFDEFWSAYPRKVGKKKARGKYQAAAKRASEEKIIAGAHDLAKDPNLPETLYIPHPSTWLERDGWEDEPLPPRGGQQSRSQQAWEADMRQILAEEQGGQPQIGGSL